jgi:hypothetical protein
MTSELLIVPVPFALQQAMNMLCRPVRKYGADNGQVRFPCAAPEKNSESVMILVVR